MKETDENENLIKNSINKKIVTNKTSNIESIDKNFKSKSKIKNVIE